MKHKKIFLGAILTLLFIAPQASNAEDRSTTFKAGYLNSAFHYEGKQGSGSDGFYVGINHEKSIIPLISIVSGLEYLQLGGDEIAGSNYTTHTLSIPVSAKVKLGPIYGLAGVAANFNLFSNGSGSTVQDMNVFDYPLHAGVGFNFLKVGVEARYNWGMRNAFDATSLDGLKTNYLQLGAYITF